MKWKDFLYFPKGDRVAIILLLALICFSGIILIYLNNFTHLDTDYIKQTEIHKKEFISFEDDMTVQPVIQDELAGKESDQNLKESRQKKPVKSKLKNGQTIDLNSASIHTLTQIPGIGDVFAKRIIEYRDSLGGFASLEQLTEIKGMSINKFSKVLPYITLKRRHQLISINRVQEKQLLRHPYFSEKQMYEIMEITQEVKIETIEDLEINTHFTSKDIKRLKPYLSFE